MNTTKSALDRQEWLPFERPPANATATSQAGARAVASRAAGQAAAILNLLRDADDGLTRAEISDRTGMLLASVCGRVRQLVLAGQLYERGDTRITQSGCPAKVVRMTISTEDSDDGR